MKNASQKETALIRLIQIAEEYLQTVEKEFGKGVFVNLEEDLTLLHELRRDISDIRVFQDKQKRMN